MIDLFQQIESQSKEIEVLKDLYRIACLHANSWSEKNVQQDKEIEELKATFQGEIDRWKSEYHRSLNLKINEITRLKSLNEAAEKVIENWKVFAKTGVSNGDEFDDIIESVDAYESLKNKP